MSDCLLSICDKYIIFQNFDRNNISLEILLIINYNILRLSSTQTQRLSFSIIFNLNKIYDSLSISTGFIVLNMQSLKEMNRDLSTIADEKELNDSQEPLDGEGPRFQQYLEAEGILDYLTLQLMSLYKSGSPGNGLHRFKHNISEEAVKKAKMEAEEEAKLGQEAMQIETEALKYRVEYLETANKKMKLQIDDLKRNA